MRFSFNLCCRTSSHFCCCNPHPIAGGGGGGSSDISSKCYRETFSLISHPHLTGHLLHIDIAAPHHKLGICSNNKSMSDSAKPTLSTKYQHSVDQCSPPRIIFYFTLYMHQTVYRIVLSCHKHCHF